MMAAARAQPLPQLELDTEAPRRVLPIDVVVGAGEAAGPALEAVLVSHLDLRQVFLPGVGLHRAGDGALLPLARDADLPVADDEVAVLVLLDGDQVDLVVQRQGPGGLL